ncbi:MAG: hypothetical protein JKY19_11175 [Alcanivoracaceae bacterium]|nr:hypothetical protein [Alcanivoracaceae bacterium]
MSTISLLFIVVFAVMAKEPDKDTNIICYAAKNKWICAPEDQQEIANKQAIKFIKENSSELKTSEVVIKTISMPTFNTATINNDKPLGQTKSGLSVAPTKPDTVQNSTVELKEVAVNDNPYAKLWSHQLIGLSTPQSAINFVKQNDLIKDEVLIVKSVRANMDWWIVLYGLYKDKKTGLENEINLPANIDKPWLRPLRNLQVLGFVEKF